MSPGLERATRAGSYLALLLHLGDSVSRHLIRPAPCVPVAPTCPVLHAPVHPPESEVAERVVELLLPRLNATVAEAADPQRLARLPWEFLLLTAFNALCTLCTVVSVRLRGLCVRYRRQVRQRGRSSSTSPAREVARPALPKALSNWVPAVLPIAPATSPKLVGGFGPKRPSDRRHSSSSTSWTS